MKKIRKGGLYEIAEENNTLVYATIELLTACNWRCKHCYIPSHDSMGLAYDVVIDIFKQLRALNTFELVLTGGEMFLRPDILLIIKEARKLGFHLQLFTNISMLNEKIIKELSHLNIGNISCTIFSCNPVIHDGITGVKGSLKAALDNAQLIKMYGLPLEIKTILLSDNYHEYDELKEYCDRNGFRYLATASVYPCTNGDMKPLTLSVTELQLREIIKDIDGYRDFKQNKFEQNEHICHSIHFSLSIDCNGRVYPCNNMSFEIGDIFEESLETIWNESKRLKYARSLRCSDLTHCGKCTYKDYCYRCAGVALAESGDLLGRDLLECMHARLRCELYS